MDTYPIQSHSLKKFYYIDGELLVRQYKEHLSDYRIWDQKDHAYKLLIFPDNKGSYISIDETSVSNGELYTIVTNKTAKGRKGCLIADIEETVSEQVIQVLESIPQEKLDQVEEVTLDLSDSMRKIIRRCFPNAIRVIDRFHVQKLAYDALQEMGIEHCWDAIFCLLTVIALSVNDRLFCSRRVDQYPAGLVLSNNFSKVLNFGKVTTSLFDHFHRGAFARFVGVFNQVNSFRQASYGQGGRGTTC